MKKIVFVTAPDARYGFNLAGIGQRVPAAGETAALLEQLMTDSDVGIIVIDERLVDAAVQECLSRSERHWAGVAVVLPSPAKEVPAADDYAMHLIRQAIGYQVRVNL